jgi:hypothetical protein
MPRAGRWEVTWIWIWCRWALRRTDGSSACQASDIIWSMGQCMADGRHSCISLCLAGASSVLICMVAALHCIALGGGHTRTFLSARRATDGGPPRAQPMPTEPPPAFNFVVVRSTRFFSFLVLGGRDREGQLLGTCSAAVPWEPLIAESNRLMKQSARHLKTTTYTL